MVESGSACIADIALEFGCEYINMDGTLNRKKMAKTVFTDKAKLKKLNALIFPYIIDSIRTRTAQLRREQQGIIVLDAPTLFESGADRECDYVVSITAPRQLRRERIIRRDRLTEEEADLPALKRTSASTPSTTRNTTKAARGRCWKTTGVSMS